VDAQTDPKAPRVRWIRPVPGPRVVLLLGAFDPPTLAHVQMAVAAGRHLEAPPALCLTAVLLDRPSETLLPWAERLELLEDLCGQMDLGLAVANRGTYLGVWRTLQRAGLRATFLIGGDKVAQLRDPAFYYPDGPAGVEATMSQVPFLVVPRGPHTGSGLPELQVLAAFDDPATAGLSASSVRDRLRRGEPVENMVPEAVARRLRGYTERPSDPWE